MNGPMFSSDPETVTVYQFQGDGGETDQLVMRTLKKTRRAVSKQYQFYFVERKHQQGIFESAYKNRIQKAVKRKEHTNDTRVGRIIH